MEIPLVPERLIPNNATPYPVTPRPWHFADAIAYSVSLNYAILDYASRYGDELLYNRYKMGRNAIERGGADYWSLKPSTVHKIATDYSAAQAPPQNESDGQTNGRRTIPTRSYEHGFKAPALRDPSRFLIPSAQVAFHRTPNF